MTAAYEQLADLAAIELALAHAGDGGGLASVQAERAALVATLPADPPAGARAPLQRAAALQAAIITALEGRRDDAARELARLRRGRGAVRAYGHVGAAMPTADRRG